MFFKSYTSVCYPVMLLLQSTHTNTQRKDKKLFSSKERLVNQTILSHKKEDLKKQKDKNKKHFEKCLITRVI